MDMSNEGERMNSPEHSPPLGLHISLSRRQFVRKTLVAGAGLAAVSSILAACGSSSSPTATTASGSASPTTAPTRAAVSNTSSGSVQPAVATTAGSPVGNGQAGAKGGTLLFNGGSNPSGFDPHIVGDTVAWNVLDNIFDRLVRLDAKTQQPVPSLAEKFDTSSDGLTYTFQLRKGVRFHNGREMKAADVKWSFERIKDPQVPAVAKGYFSDLDRIEAPDDYTIKLIYKKTFAPVLTALTRLETAILPQEEVAKKDAWSTHPIGSGPFKFVSYTKDQAIVMERNPDYWEQGLPKLDRVEQRVITKNETAVINVQTGAIHVTGAAATDLAKLKGSKGVKVELINSTFWPHLSLNCSKPPFDDVRVRQAIRLAVKREDIQSLAFENLGLVSNTMLPEGNPYRAEVDGWKYDLAKAKQLLSDAGQSGGFKTKLRITPSTAWQTPAAQIIQDNLKALNITVEIEQIEATTWFSEVFAQSQFEMSMTAHASKVDPDLSMFDILHSGQLGTKNYTKFSDPAMDKLLDMGRATADPEARKKIYADAQKIFVEQTGYIVLNLQQQVYGLRDTVQGFALLPTGELRWKETSLSA
jgi:peptide/nickel transport system substrate-binding protein